LVPQSCSSAPVLGQKGSLGVPTSSVLPCNTCHTMHCSQHVSHDVEKLHRLVRYIRGTADLGVVLRPGELGIVVRLYVDASYGMHNDGKSHTGACVVIGDGGAVNCRPSKQEIVVKSSTEGELVAVSNAVNQSLSTRQLLMAQGYKIGPVILYQDNLSCMAMLATGRSGSERTRHIAIRYYWTKERVDNG
jgi:hypothetical protein